MNNRNQKLCLSLMLVAGLIGQSSLFGQIFTAPLQASTTGTNPVDFEFRADGTMIAKGNLGVGSLLTTDMGAGTRMLWYPNRGAFRAGTVTGTEWNDQWNISAIGNGSVAFGQDNEAWGTCSIATGQNSQAGEYSVAMGYSAYANYQAVALGIGCSAVGNWSAAFGINSSAIGFHSTAVGFGCTSYGDALHATGYATSAVGNDSASFNDYTTASSYCSTAMGLYNVGGGNATTWVATDPLFELGNGTGSSKSDALVVYKNGNAVLQGTITIAPGGDIPMFAGY